MNRPRCLSLPPFVAVLAAFALAGCAVEDDDSVVASSESAVTNGSLSPLLADVLAGGELRCTQQLSDIRHRGDVHIIVAPAKGRPGAWTSSTKLAGSVFTHPYGASDGAFNLRVNGAGEITGKRSVSHGDIGHGYYCGGGAASAWCGPDREDKVRFYVEGASLRCEVQATMDEPWGDHFTYDVQSSAVRLSGCFDEAFYLASNKDVAAAVHAGQFVNGRHHFALHGAAEGRAACPSNEKKPVE